MSDLTVRVASAMLAAVLLAACGGDGTKPSASRVSDATSGAPTPSGSPATTAPSAGTGVQPGAPTSGQPGQPGRPVASGTPGGDPRATAGAQGRSGSPAATPTSDNVDLGAKLSKSCVMPGSTLTVTLRGRPRMKVIYNTTYSDRSDGQTHGGFSKEGWIDENGAYSSTWTVSPTAPQGDATFFVAAVDGYGNGHDRIPLKVALAC